MSALAVMSFERKGEEATVNGCFFIKKVLNIFNFLIVSVDSAPPHFQTTGRQFLLLPPLRSLKVASS